MKTLLRSAMCLVFFSVIVLASALASGDEVEVDRGTTVRTWTDVTGKYRSQARFVELKGDRVVLEKPDAKEVTVPLGRLSIADREYVSRQVQKSTSKSVSPEEPDSGRTPVESRLESPSAARMDGPADAPAEAAPEAPVGPPSEGDTLNEGKGGEVGVPLTAVLPKSPSEVEVELCHSGQVWYVPTEVWEDVKTKSRRGGTSPIIGDRQSSALPAANPPDESIAAQPDESIAAKVETVSPTASREESVWASRLLITLAPPLLSALVVVTALVYYLRVWAPRRRRRPLDAAIEIIERDEQSRFENAEQLLDQALTAGLKDVDVAEARFALAYVRARRNRLGEAESVVADLRRSRRVDRATIYLEMWIKRRKNEDEEVEQIYVEHAEQLNGFLQANLMLAIAYLARARRHWRNKEIQGAIHYFERLRDLGLLLDQIPTQIDDHQVILGIQSLFQNSVDDARKLFLGALTTAETKGTSPFKARLGLILCDWKSSELPVVDEELSPLVQELLQLAEIDGASCAICYCSHCDTRHRVRKRAEGQQVVCPSCSKRFKIAVATDEEADSRQVRANVGPASTAEEGDNVDGTAVDVPSREPSKTAPETAASADDHVGLQSEDGERPEVLLDEEELLLRNVMLWYAVSLLTAWQILPEKEGLPKEQAERFEVCIDTLLDRHPRFEDALLLLGLVRYYFAQDESDRHAGLEMIEKACECGVTLPEVFSLCERERKLAQLQADSLNRYLILVKEYVGNEQVPEHYRKKLQERLAGYRRFRDLGDIEVVTGDGDSAPSTQDLQSRGAVVSRRIGRIISSLDADDVKTISNLVDGYNRTIKDLDTEVKKFESHEAELLGATGEFLLKEEELDT